MWVNHLHVPWLISCHMNKIWNVSYRLQIVSASRLMNGKILALGPHFQDACQIFKHLCTLHEAYRLRTLFVHTTWHINGTQWRKIEDLTVFAHQKVLTVWIWAILLCKRQNNTRKQRGVKFPYVVFIYIAKFRLKKEFAQPGHPGWLLAKGFSCRWRVKLVT